MYSFNANTMKWWIYFCILSISSKSIQLKCLYSNFIPNLKMAYHWQYAIYLAPAKCSCQSQYHCCRDFDDAKKAIDLYNSMCIVPSSIFIYMMRCLAYTIITLLLSKAGECNSNETCNYTTICSDSELWTRAFADKSLF